MTGEFVADLVDAGSISRDRLAAALAAAVPSALRWCDAPASKVSRRALGEALIASLPQALRLTWPEVLARARLPESHSVEPACFAPEIDVFDGRRKLLTVRLAVELVLTPRIHPRSQDPADVAVRVTLCVADATQRAAFHEVTRELALSISA